MKIFNSVDDLETYVEKQWEARSDYESEHITFMIKESRDDMHPKYGVVEGIVKKCSLSEIDYAVRRSLGMEELFWELLHEPYKKTELKDIDVEIGDDFSYEDGHLIVYKENRAA